DNISSEMAGCSSVASTSYTGSPASSVSTPVSPSPFSSGRKDQHKMLIHVDTCVATYVDLQHLPTTPCMLLCGESPMAASAVMAAEDQVVVHDRIFTFTEAVNDMFMIYYVLNIDDPVVEVEQQWSSFKENPEAAG
ncbi:hypothetical protein KUCAC02_016887, partial [Chaenocephalus aceratus]